MEGRLEVSLYNSLIQCIMGLYFAVWGCEEKSETTKTKSTGKRPAQTGWSGLGIHANSPIQDTEQQRSLAPS